MVARTLAFSVGIYLLFQFTSLPPLWVALIFPLLFIISGKYRPFWPVVFLFFGFCWALFRAHYFVEQPLLVNAEDTDIYIRGTVTNMLEQRIDHIRFIFHITDSTNHNGDPVDVPERVRLSWYRTQERPKPGQEWQFKVRLKRPYGFMNSGGFDYELWMMRQGIKATGYIKENSFNALLTESQGYYFERLRCFFKNKILASLDEPVSGLVLALSLGDRSKLTPEQWQVLVQTGTSHLIAISGLHLSLIAGFIYFLSIYLWGRSFMLTQRFPAPFFAAFMAFLAAFFYAGLAGFSLPTQRALIMIGVFLVALLSSQKPNLLDVLFSAAILILLLDPFAIVAVDFWLSFSAVFFIIYITRYRITGLSRLYQWLRLQTLLTLALVPLLAFWFKQFPLYSVFANLVAIPLTGLLLLPLCLAGLLLVVSFPVIAKCIYEVMSGIQNFQWYFLDFLARQEHALWPIAATNMLSLILAFIGVLLLLMPKGLPARYLGAVFFLPLIFPGKNNFTDGDFNLNLLDVGQGLSAIVQTKKHVLVYDTGARFSNRFNIGDAVITPFLRDKGVNSIDVLMISHGDNDHIGGAMSLLQAFKVRQLIGSELISQPELNFKHCQKGQQWNWDGVTFEVLHPYDIKTLSANDASCVLRVSSKYGAVLLTGDIEKRAEQGLVLNSPEKLAADILVVPHHGSRTSSTPQFIRTVSARHAFFSTGYKNRFGFPKQDIMDRYEAEGIVTRVTYETGEISAKFRETGLQIDEYRTKNRRFWHHNAQPIQGF